MVAQDMLSLRYDTKRPDKDQVHLSDYFPYSQIVVSRLVGNGNAANALAASDGSLTDAFGRSCCYRLD